MSSARPRHRAREVGRGGGGSGRRLHLLKTRLEIHWGPCEMLNKNHKRILEQKKPKQFIYKMTN